MYRSALTSSVALRSVARAATANAKCRLPALTAAPVPTAVTASSARSRAYSSNASASARSVRAPARWTAKHTVAMRGYSSKSYPSHTVITMPALSPTMTQGNLGAWHKKVGEEVTPGDVIVEIETDKAQMDFECQDEGFLAKILVDSGAKDVPINTPIAVFAENEADIAEFANFSPEGAAEKAPAPAKKEEKPKESAPKKEAAPKQETAASPAKPAAPAPQSGDRVIASPLAKVMAAEKGINLQDIKGSGPNGRIVKVDVQSFVPASKPAEATKKASQSAPKGGAAPAAGEYTDVPLTNMRKVIAQRLTQSKQEVPHYYLTVEIEMDKTLKLREILNRDAKNGAPKLSVNDFVVKASALALKAVPEANSAWNGDFVRQYHNADICVATSTPGGLITPIVRKAETLGLSTISTTVKDLASRAREGKLQPQEYQGGSFTISNLGMFGVKSFTAIINPPQACILAVGTTEKKVVSVQNETGTGFEERSVMHVSLSCDHRVVDGAVGATWLKAFKGYMEQPLTMLL